MKIINLISIYCEINWFIACRDRPNHVKKAEVD